jgi:hypothetical protein
MWKYKKKGRWVYAMYKGDECLAIGTSDEICEQMGIKKNTFGFYRTKTYLERAKDLNWKNYKTIVRIDNEVEE